MIKSVWKPHYEKSKIVFYEKKENNELLNLKGKTAYKVIWVCDDPKCKTKEKIHSISACHLIKPNLCYDLQICRPCQCTGEGNGRYKDNRKWEELYSKEKLESLKSLYSNKWKGNLNPSKKNEVKIKKNQPIIDNEYLKIITEGKNFKIIKIVKLDGKNSELLVECQNKHKSFKKYNNFVRKDKTFICQRCYYDSISLNLTEEEVKKFENYKKQVRALTAKNYKLNKDFINPNGLKIGKKNHHIDHKYSIHEGYKNGIDCHIIASKENLQVIPYNENLSKQSKCSISLSELIDLTNYLL